MEHEEVIQLNIKESVEIKSRTYFSIQHIISAALFARQSASLEREYKGQFSDQLHSEHRAYVTGVIFSAAAFLEALINELFADTVENEFGRPQQLDPEVKTLMAELWKLDVPRTASFKILQKYQIALAIAERQLFDLGSSPYQEVHLIIQLRNDLIHYEPEWIHHPSEEDTLANQIHKYEKRLRGKFKTNPLTGEGNPFYPDKCLGHGCAEWVVNSTLRFADEFFSRIGVKPTYDHVRERLNTN